MAATSVLIGRPAASNRSGENTAPGYYWWVANQIWWNSRLVDRGTIQIADRTVLGLDHTDWLQVDRQNRYAACTYLDYAAVEEGMGCSAHARQGRTTPQIDHQPCHAVEVWLAVFLIFFLSWCGSRYWNCGSTWKSISTMLLPEALKIVSLKNTWFQDFSW